MKAVFNSSPLIFLSKLNILNDAFSLFSEIAVPAFVYKEISNKEDFAFSTLRSFINSEELPLIEPRNTRMVEALGHKLGRGESEAIVIAIESISDFVILDDHVARQEALRNGLEVKGTLGIIKRLMDLSIVQFDLNHLYQDLISMNFRVTHRIFNKIFN